MDEPKFNGMTRKEIVRAWIKALESGEYKQERGYLCQVRGSKRSYCCLGVLCDITHIPSQGPTAVYYDLNGATHIVGYKGGKHYNCRGLPAALGNFLRINSLGSLNRSVADVSLTDLNDAGESFMNIANVIRRGHVKGLEDAPELLEGM